MEQENLENVWREAESYLDNETEVSFFPREENEPGNYSFDLVAFQEKNPEATSKMALKEFFEKTPFKELKLLCHHIPPWIEALENLEVSSQSQGQVKEVVLRKKCSY